MTIDEAKNLDLVSSEFCSIKEAKSKGYIPEYYHSCINEHCFGCNSDLAVNRSLTRIFCVNPKCNLKMTGRAVKLLNNFGIKGIGRAYCDSYFSSNPEFKTHLAILYGKRTNYIKTNRIADSVKLMDNLYNIRLSPITFADLVSKLALPDLGCRAKQIFRNFANYNEFENEVNKTTNDIVKFLIQYDGIDLILAKKIERTLKIFAEDLRDITNYFSMRPVSHFTLKLCLTGDMEYGCMTKNEFETFLNLMGSGYIDVEVSNARMSADYIVSKYANEYVKDENGDVLRDENSRPIIVDYTAKHNIGKQRSIAEGRKVLVSPEEIVNIITRYVSLVNKRKVISK